MLGAITVTPGYGDATAAPETDAGAAAVAVLGTLAAAPGTITATQAAQTVADTDPLAVAAPASAPGGAVSDPGVTAAGGSFSATPAGLQVSISKAPAGGAAISNGDTILKVAPVAVAGSATPGQAVDGGGAVVYANTSTDGQGTATADTVVQPTATGVESFTDIRSSAAPTAYGMKIDLSGGLTLRATPDGGVAIVSSTAAAGAVSTSAGELDALKSSGQAPAAAALADPEAAAKVSDAVAAAGVPANPDPAKPPTIDPAQLPAPAGGAVASQDPSGAPGDAPSSTVAQTITRVNADARATAGSEVASRAATDQAGAASAQQLDLAAAQEAAAQTGIAPAQGTVVATIAPPTSVDASGQSVPTTLSIAGDVVTMHVDTNASSYSYPIVADPQVEMQKLIPVWRDQTQYVTYLAAWIPAGTWYSSWIPQHPNRYQVPGTEWWVFWSPEYNDWALMQDTVTGGSPTSVANYYLLVNVPVFANIPTFDHYDYIPASSAIQSVSFGVDEDSAVSPSDMASVGVTQADLDTTAVTATAAAYAVKKPHCAWAHAEVSASSVLEGSSNGAMKFRFCYDKYTQKARWDKAPPIITSYNPVPDQVVGTFTGNHDWTPSTEYWNGAFEGLAHMHSSYDVYQVVGLFSLGYDVVLGTHYMDADGHYDGSVFAHVY